MKVIKQPFIGQPTNQATGCSGIQALVESIYIPYRGQLIERTLTGFSVDGAPVGSVEAAKELIDGKRAWQGKSVVNF